MRAITSRTFSPPESRRQRLLDVVAGEAERAGQGAQRADGRLRERMLERLPAPCRRRRAAPSSAGRSSPASRARRARRCPASGSATPGDELEQRRLARAVRAHHAPALARDGSADRSRGTRRARRRPCRRRSSSHHVVARARRGPELELERLAPLGRGSTFSILSSFFTRDCTCAAWLARALKRAMNASSLASIACWRCVLRLLLRCSDSARWRS